MSTEDKSYEDYFDELANEDTQPTNEPEDYEFGTEGGDDTASQEDVAESVTEGETEAEAEDDRPRDEHGRFVAKDSDEAEPELDERAAELERYKKEAEQWQHRYNSDLGRQNALQRKIQEQQAMIQDLESRASANPTGSGMSDSEWNTLVEDFPEIASAMEAKLQSVSAQYEQRMQQLQSQMEPIQQQAQQQYVQAQYAVLEQQHPDWKDVATSQNFQSWLNTQPDPVRSLVNSDHAADAAYLIHTYKLENSMAQDNTANEIRQRREKQLRQGQTITNRGGRPKSTMPPEDDFEAAFDYFAAR